MIVSVLLAQAVLAIAALAIPAGSVEVAKRNTTTEQPSIVPLSIVGQKVGTAAAFPATNPYYAGAGISGSDGSFDFVAAEFDLPAAHHPANDVVRSRTAALIGIDLLSDCASFLVAGVQIVVIDNSTFYLPFYEWRNQILATFDNVTVDENDEVAFTVLATSLTTAVLTISKNTNEQFQRVSLSFPGGPLCLSTPVWLVGSQPDQPVANFGDIAFDGAIATNGTNISGPLDPNAFVTDIERDGTVFTEVGRGGQSVSIRYSQ